MIIAKQTETARPAADYKYLAIAEKIKLTAEQIKEGYQPGWNDIVYDVKKKKDIGESSCWRTADDAGRIALERIRDIELSQVWRQYEKDKRKKI
jgi:hypothetical protein